MSEKQRYVKQGGGVGLGGLLAVLVSWHVNHSVGWAILHFFFGWAYVIFAVLTKHLR